MQHNTFLMLNRIAARNQDTLKGVFCFHITISTGLGPTLVRKVQSLRDQSEIPTALVDFYNWLLYSRSCFVLEKFRKLCQPVLKAGPLVVRRYAYFCLWLFFRSPHHFVKCPPHSLPHHHLFAVNVCFFL